MIRRVMARSRPRSGASTNSASESDFLRTRSASSRTHAGGPRGRQRGGGAAAVALLFVSAARQMPTQTPLL
jgi:hypothetical protein